jgi:hypothetical protein
MLDLSNRTRLTESVQLQSFFIVFFCGILNMVEIVLYTSLYICLLSSFHLFICANYVAPSYAFLIQAIAKAATSAKCEAASPVLTMAVCEVVSKRHVISFTGFHGADQSRLANELANPRACYTMDKFRFSQCGK